MPDLLWATMTPQVQAFHDERSKTLSYIVHSGHGTACAIIDSVLDFDPASGHTNSLSIERLVEFVQSRDLAVEWILETHIHHDHLSGAAALKERVGGKTGIGERYADVAQVIRAAYNLPKRAGDNAFDKLFQDGETFTIGSLPVHVLYTPGHTRDSVSYLIGDAVFVGDVLFMPDFGTGRCNFHGGDARALYRSIRRLLSLPGSTRMFICHDYCPGGRPAAWETTVAHQRAENVHIRDGVDEDSFVALRIERDRGLRAPLLLLPSLQVNIQGGRLPEAEANGTIYLKMPVNIPGHAI